MVGWFEKTLVFKMKKIACLLGIVHVAHNFYVSEPYIYNLGCGSGIFHGSEYCDQWVVSERESLGEG